MKTPAEARKHWAEVLRTDRFKQGKGALEYVDKNGETLNCCLGVLCRLYLEDGGELTIIQQEDGEKLKTCFNNSYAVMPAEVSAYVGMHSGLGRLKSKTMLASLNDDGVSFKEIAEIIDGGQLDTQI